MICKYKFPLPNIVPKTTLNSVLLVLIQVIWQCLVILWLIADSVRFW